MSKEAMKQALDFLRSGHFVYPTKIATDLEEALAKQEQGEPVAWIHKRSGRIIGHKPYGSIDDWDSLYTTPQQRKPLTDEQAHEAIGTAGVDLLELAKLWSDNEIHVYQFDNEAQKIIKAVLLRANGIKE